MWYLILAIIGSSSLVVILKLFQLKGVNLHVGITINYVVASVLCFAMAGGVTAAHIFSSPWLWAAALVGAMFSLSFVVFALSAQRSGVAVTTISGRAAVVIPVVFAFTVLDDQVTPMKIAMLAVILAAMVMILKRSGGGKGKAQHLWFVLPLGVFLFNGSNDTLVQYAQSELVPDEDYIAFLATMFAAGAVTAVVTFFLSAIRHPHKPGARDLQWGALLGVMNWICMIGVFYALDFMDGSVFFPLYYTGAIVLSTVAGVFAFKEKLSRLNYAGIVLAVIAIAVLSMQ